MKSRMISIALTSLLCASIALASDKPASPGAAQAAATKNRAFGKDFTPKAVLSRAGYTSYDRKIIITDQPMTCEQLLDGNYTAGQRLVSFYVDWKSGAKPELKTSELVFKEVGPAKMLEDPATAAVVEVLAAPDNRKGPGRIKVVAKSKDGSLDLETVVTQCE